MSAPTNPIVAAFAATTWWMRAIREFDAIEVHPCRAVGKTEDGRDVIEQCEPEQAGFWSVYGHCCSGGLECFEDFATETEAEEFKRKLLNAYPHLRADEVLP